MAPSSGAETVFAMAPKKKKLEPQIHDSSSGESSESTMSNATFDKTFKEHMGDEARAMDASA